ncbi:MAG: DUF1189 family protein [Proteobacteria bacterium]|nr:DUF1189 family protein [Pseudomonadota bacterium]
MQKILKGALSSFYSRQFYADLARNGQGIGVEFIVVLTVIQLALFLFPMQRIYPQLQGFVQQVPMIAKDLPTITSKDGRLSIDKPVPYQLKFPDNQHHIIVFDPDYSVTDVNELTQKMAHDKIVVLVTANTLIIYDETKHEVRINDLKDMRPFTVTHDNWLVLGEQIKKWGMPVFLTFFFVTTLIGLLLYNFIATFFAAIIVKILGAIARAGLKFDSSMHLASAARIPSNLIMLLPLLVGGEEIRGVAPLLIFLAYIVFAVWSGRQANTQTA